MLQVFELARKDNPLYIVNENRIATGIGVLGFTKFFDAKIECSRVIKNVFVCQEFSNADCS